MTLFTPPSKGPLTFHFFLCAHLQPRISTSLLLSFSGRKRWDRRVKKWNSRLDTFLPFHLVLLGLGLRQRTQVTTSRPNSDVCHSCTRTGTDTHCPKNIRLTNVRKCASSSAELVDTTIASPKVCASGVRIPGALWLTQRRTYLEFLLCKD